MSNRETYKALCRTRTLPLFIQPEWWDAHYSYWDVLMVSHEGYTLYFPYCIEKKWSIRFIRNPRLTPYSGYIFSDTQTPLEIQHILVQKWKEAIPTSQILQIDLFPENGLAISNPSWVITEKITNLLSLSNVEEVYKKLKPALQRQIKKATKNLVHVESDDITLFYSLYEKTFLKQHIKPAFKFSDFERVWKFCKKNNAGQIYFCKDDVGNIHAALLLVYDADKAYYLAGGTDANFYGSGAMSYLMWHAIQKSMEMGKLFFDFEGSMLPNVNRFFQNFSGDEIKYLSISKIDSIWYAWIKKMKTKLTARSH